MKIHNLTHIKLIIQASYQNKLGKTKKPKKEPSNTSFFKQKREM